MEHFVAGTTARCASELIEINRNTAAYYYQRLREIITHHLEQESIEIFDGEIEVDESYFGGTYADFELARRTNPNTPILRKDFMIDEYQIIEAKSMGADVILLIAAALSPSEIKTLGTLARSLGMETLLEVHDQEELDRSLGDYISVVGVNNRNLKNFSEQNVEASKVLADKIPAQFVKVSESCISGPEIITELKNYGYRGFLIGESFMKTDNPGKALSEFIR